MLLLRGVLAFVFGLLCFAYPGGTPRLMVIVFGSYMLIDGLLAVAAAITRAKTQERWWSTLLEGLVGSLIGVLILTWPGITALGLLYLIAVWALLTGIFKIVAAIRLRRHIICSHYRALFDRCRTSFTEMGCTTDRTAITLMIGPMNTDGR